MSGYEQRPLLVARPRRSQDVALTIVIPAFNEAFRLPVVLDALRLHVDARTTEIIVVDDGSTDATAEVARRTADWAEHLVVIETVTNAGKGAAVRRGVAAARGTTIGFIDADNATDLSALGDMVAGLDARVGAVFGSRHAPGSAVTGAPLLRGVMGRVFNHVVRFAAGTSIQDTQCGAKVFRGAAARLAFGAASVDGFAFDVEVLRLLLNMKLAIVEHPVRWHYVHGTKIRPTTPLRMLADIAKVRFGPQFGPCAYLDAVWADELDDFTDPLSDSGASLEAGSPVRIALPFIASVEELSALSGSPTGDGYAEVLRIASESGAVDHGQSRTWLQLSGTSPS